MRKLPQKRRMCVNEPELPAALKEAIGHIKNQRTHALIEIRIAPT
jgi:hypothetical protein